MIEELYSRYCGCGFRVTTDSRAVQGGEMFFALKGENFNGNQYASRALETGASWAVVDEDVCEGDPRVIRVPDVFSALQQLAVWHRTHVRGGKLPVFGLTGTNGKTTTKELINAVLSRKFKVTATQGNLNNDIGVPLSILKITPETEIAVIEMGASHPDDIAKLVKVSQPDCGLVTNVGKAHLLGFGSFEGVKAAKGELYKWLAEREDSLVFINGDDENLTVMASERGVSRTSVYGLTAQNATVLPSSPEEPFVRIDLDGTLVRSNLVGSYNALNILAAIAVGVHFGVSRDDAVAAIESYVPSNNRSQMVRTSRNTLIVDAYNANPSSMSAALANFRNVDAPRKLALLGDMRELGDDSVAEHVKVVRSLDDDIEVCLVGEEFRKALDECGEISGIKWFASSEELASCLHVQQVRGYMVLVKGSRGIQMEKVLPEL